MVKSLIFEGDSLEGCLKKACEELKMKKESLDYSILEEKKGLFKKYVKIQVQVKKAKSLGYIADGRVHIKNLEDSFEKIKIIAPEDITIIVNGEEKRNEVKIDSKDIVEFILPECDAVRKCDVNISKDEMEVSLNISIKPQLIYGLKDCGESAEILLEKEVLSEEYPPFFSSEEIIEILADFGIKYGVNVDKLKDIVDKKEEGTIVIAKGIQPREPQHESLKVYINTEKKPIEDEKGTIDYKSIGYMPSVNAGDILAEKIDGEKGQRGITVYGKVIEPSKMNVVRLKCGKGCKIIEENKIVAEIKGLPSIKNDVFTIEDIHTIEGDVDIKIGNVFFDGAVVVKGNVVEGMEVTANGDVMIYKNVSGAKISSKKNITINGKILSSNIESGKEDSECVEFMKITHQLELSILSLKDSVNLILSNSNKNNNLSVREVIFKLIETHYKSIPKLCKEITEEQYNKRFQCLELQYILQTFIKGSKINTTRDLRLLDEIIEGLRKAYIKAKEISISKSDIVMDYIQDGIAIASGNIIINGKGEYVSNIRSGESVYFNGYNSYARGGTIKAKKEIKAKIVGSTAGVHTLLEVDKEGKIWADKVYHNTKIKIGNAECMISEPCKNFHAYLDQRYEIAIECLKM